MTDKRLGMVEKVAKGPAAVDVGCAALELSGGANPGSSVKALQFTGTFRPYIPAPALKPTPAAVVPKPKQMEPARAADFASYLNSALYDLSAL